MMTQLKCRLLAIILFLFPLVVGLAEPPSGTLFYSFDTDNAPVWDFTGTFQFEHQLQGEGFTDFSFGIAVTQDGNGRLTGSGVTIIAVGSDFMAGDYTVKGRVSTSGGLARVSMTVRIKGQGILAGRGTSYAIIITYNATVDPETFELVGRARGSARFADVGKARIKSDFSIPVPEGVTGAWTLVINVLPLAKLGGIAFLTPSSGQTIQFDVGGSYSASHDEAKIKLSGTTPNESTQLVLVVDGAGDILAAKGRVLGQRVRQTSFDNP
jgi:hypothetical protein